MENKLKLGDFKRTGIRGSYAHYFSHVLPDGREVCLEACMNGYCVGVYDKPEGQLIGDKQCTKLEGFFDAHILPGYSMMPGEALTKAIEMANKMI